MSEVVLLRTLLICLLARSHADTLSGRVVDPAGAPIAAARVVLEELGRGTLTGGDGTFVFPSVPPGRYTLVVRRLGYGAATTRVVLPAGAALTIVLQGAPATVAPITVTATRDPLDRAASPFSTDEVTEEQLRRTSGPSLARALEEVPGVRSVSTGSAVGKPVIRGLAGARVLVLDDGHPAAGYSWDNEDGPSVDARLAERVEVIRGPTSLLYGSDAIGGVVNVIPEALPDAPAGVSVRRGQGEVYGATNNTELGTALRGEAAQGDWSGRLVAVARHADNLHTPLGELDNTGFEMLNGEAVLGTHGGRGSASLRYARSGGEFHLLEATGPDTAGGGAGGGPERKVSDNRVQFTGNYPVGGVRLESKAQWQRHWVAEVADSAPGVEAEVINLLLNTYTLDVLAHHSLAGRTTGTVGVSGSYQTNATRGPVPLVPGARTTAGGVFAVEEWAVARWRLLAGVRADMRHLAVDADAALALGAQTREYRAASGDIGAVYQLDGGLSLAANVGRAWRAPDLFELFAGGPHLEEARYDRGDATLVPETSWNVDGGLRWRGRSGGGELALYHNRIEHFIYVAPTNQVIDSLRVYQTVQTRATLWGGEATVQVEVLDALSLRAQADFVHGTNDQTGRPLPLMPPLRGALEAEVHGHTADGGGSYAGFEAELVARQERLASDSIPGSPAVTVDVPTAGYALLHLEAGLARRLGGRLVRLDLRVRNATNTRYRDYLSRYKEFALDAGRNVVLRVVTEF